MSVQVLEKTETRPSKPRPNSFQQFWDSLTRPSPLLKPDEQQKARLLAAMLIVFMPLAVLTVFANPIINFLGGRPAVLPAPGIMVALALIPVTYGLSRTRHYVLGARLLLVIPLIAVLAPIVGTRGYTTVTPLFYLTITVTVAGLLLSSRDTFYIGIALTILIFLIPRSPTADPAVVTGNQSTTAATFVMITTGITVLVGRIREKNLLQLETKQRELAASLAETEKARTQADAARERAERSDKVKSAFLASMSHELRTPLNAIINFTEFVVAGDTGDVNDEQKELLTEVVNSGKHLLNLINDVLDMSKIEAGSLNLFIEDNINLKAILEGSVTTCKGLVKEGVQFQTEIAADLPTIRADRQRVLQIMLNILSNACKFTEKGEVKLKAVAIRDEIIISVSDTGPGIAAEDQDRVFEAFKQTKTGLRQGSGGTGLGMPIARSLAQAHKGRLWLESQLGKGSIFYVALPIKSEALKPTI
jgi:signal transduction histidine kinase